MLFLILTILSSVLTSVILKINEGRGGNRLVVAGMNYIVAAALAYAFGDPSRLALGGKWTMIALATGVGFVAGFLIMMKGLKEIGLAIPTSAARLSMLIPVTGSIIFFDERPSPLQIAGICAGVAAFILLGAAQRTAQSQSRLDLRAIAILVAVFSIVGATDFTMKTMQINGVDKDAMSFFIFCSAALCCWIPVLARRVPVSRHDLLLGALLGVPNYFSVYFLLLALGSLNASVVFPTVSAGAVVTVTATAIIFWKEHPNRTAWMGILLAAIAVALLGLQGGS